MTEQQSEERFDLRSTYSDNLPKILAALDISLVVTSYQAAQLIMIRTNGENIVTASKAFPRPMGLHVDGDRITLGTETQVLSFNRSDGLLAEVKSGAFDDTSQMTKKAQEKNTAAQEEFIRERNAAINDVKKADSLYLHRAAITTGMINIHDIAWGDEGLWVVNSVFSCLATLSPDHSFVARWMPPFVSALAPANRCHLNGMAMRDGQPAYVTTFNRGDHLDSWTSQQARNQGTLIDVQTNRILIDDLILPHSPRYHDGWIYVCESGRGVVWQVNPLDGARKQVVKLPGFVRGLAFYGDLMWVGLSRLRDSETGWDMPLRDEFAETVSGIWLVSLRNNQIIAHLQFEDEVHQLYDIGIVPGSLHPELLGLDSPLIRHLYDYSEDFL